MAFTEAELIERRKFLGASECAAAIGVSKWMTPLEVYLSKLGKGEPIETTIPMMVGTALEPVCLALYERDTGDAVHSRQHLFTDPGAPWRRCTVDGMTDHGEIVEAKSSGQFADWGDADDEIPLQYLFNIHHSFACIPGSEVAVFPVILGARDFRIYRVKRDEGLVEDVRAAEAAFWKMVREQTPPAPTTDGDIKLLYPRDNFTTVIATPEVEAVARKWAVAKAQEKVVEEQVKAFGVELKAFMGEAAALRTTLTGGKGDVLATFNTSTPTSIDLDKLRREFPDVARACEKQSPRRTLLCKIKEPK